MSDVRLLEDIVVHILESIDKVERRFSDIRIPDDFLRDGGTLKNAISIMFVWF